MFSLDYRIIIIYSVWIERNIVSSDYRFIIIYSVWIERNIVFSRL